MLPSSAPDLLDAPTATTPVFIAISLGLTVIFLFMFTFTAHRAFLGKAGALFERPQIQRATAWIGFMGFIIGMSTIVSGGSNISSVHSQASRPSWCSSCGSRRPLMISTTT